MPLLLSTIASAMSETIQIELNNAAIGSVVETASTSLKEADVAKRTALRVTLLLEELLLRYQDEFGEQTTATFSISKRLGMLNIRVEIEGPMLNALEIVTADDDFGNEHNFVAVLADKDLEPPSYRYAHGINILAINVRLEKKRAFWVNPLLLATVLSVLAYLGLSYADPDLAANITEGVVTPCASMLMGVLRGITGPLLSISLISGICALGDMATLKGTGVRAILRIMAWVIIMFVACAVVSSLFYGGAVGRSATSFNPNELFNLLLSAIPQNIVSPFVEGNSLQIAVESAFVGVCILALGEHSTLIRKFVVELNSLIFKMMFLFSKLLPVLVFLTIFQVLMTTDVSSLKDIGLIVAVNYACVAVIVVGVFIWVRVSLRISPLLYVRKLWPALYIALTTGSASSSMGEFFRISSEKLGISKTIVDFWAPLGHALFASSAIVPLVVGPFAVANMQGVEFDETSILVLFVLVFQLSIATPKVPGGIAASYTIILSQLGLPPDSVGILMAANVFIVNVECAFGSFVRFTAECSFAKSMHAIDEEKLRSKN